MTPTVIRIRTTLFDLVSAISESAANDAETIAAVTDWVGSGFLRTRIPRRTGSPPPRGGRPRDAAPSHIP
jgi:hypothetical protein